MATKVQVKKVAVSKPNGRIDRTKTVQAVLATFGPMDDRTLTANLQRVDDTANLTNVQWALYQLRNDKKLAKKVGDIWSLNS